MMRVEARNERRPPKVLELSCPRCDAAVTVAFARCVEGATVHCPGCGAEPELTRERVEHTRRTRWVLVDPDLEGPEDERR